MSHISQISQKEQGFFLLNKIIHYKYRKNRKNNKCNQTQDLQENEDKKGPEISKYRKSNKNFSC